MNKKKVYIINASPRKNRNTDKMAKALAQGINDSNHQAEIIYLYDINFKGCYSCFSCKLKNSKNYGKCTYKDELSEILNKASNSDGIVFATPIYFNEISGIMKMFTERLFFPFFQYDKNYTPIPPKKLKTAVIYTMNVEEEVFNNQYIKENNLTPLILFESWIEKIYEKPKRICAYNTYQFNNYNNYYAPLWSESLKAKHQKENFPNELKNAYNTGLTFFS